MPRVPRTRLPVMRERPPQRSPYAAFPREEMVLRDHLAIDRTSLANERTLMASVRTSLALMLGGASAIHFLAGLGTDLVGLALLGAAPITFIQGVRRYFFYKRRIERTDEVLSSLPTPGLPPEVPPPE